MANKKIVGLVAGGAMALAMPLVQQHEGRVNHAYLDPIGIPTICDGHTHGVHMGMTATDAQCDEWLRQDMQHAMRTVDRNVVVELPDSTRAAFASFVYNAGSGNFSRSTMLRLANAGELIRACKEFDRWVYAGGRDCRVRANNCYGIIKRRADEKAMCLAGLQGD